MSSSLYIDKGEEDSPIVTTLPTTTVLPDDPSVEQEDPSLFEGDTSLAPPTREQPPLTPPTREQPPLTPPTKSVDSPSSDTYMDKGEEDSPIVTSLDVDKGEEDSPIVTPKDSIQPPERSSISVLTPDEVGPYLEKLNPEAVNTLYDRLQGTQVPTEAGPKSEQDFIRSQNVDDMPVPMAGPEPDWDDVLNVTTQEERQQAQQDKKKARIINMAEQAYKNNLNPEARRKYVEDKVRNGQKLSTYEEKLQEYGVKAILSDLQDVMNPNSDLRSGKETGEELNQWQAVAYMLKLDGYDEGDGVYKFHKATGGNAWVMMNQTMADGLKVGAGYMNAMENALNVAYDNGLPQIINKLIRPIAGGRRLFTDDIAKDMSNFHSWLGFVGLDLPEAIAPTIVALTGMSIKAFRTGVGMLTGSRTTKALGGAGRRVPAQQRGATVISAIDKGEFKDRHYREWIKWREGGEKGRPPPGAARVNTYFARLGKIKEAKKVARANSKLQQKLLGETRERIKNQFDIDIVDEVNGRLVINPERLREAGTLSTRKAFDASNQTTAEKAASAAGFDVGKVDELAGIRTGTSEIIDVMLNPEMFDQMIAVTADLRKTFPDALKTTGDERLIDKLFDLTVNKDLLGENAPQLQKVLDKYNISFENYSLALVGSGSDAGKVLNKLSQLKRLRTADELGDEARKATEEAHGAVRRWVMRVENIRRGLLVSQFATAARNLTSAGIRMPLEALGNVMDNVLYAAAEGGIKAGAKTAFSKNNWKGSFRGLTYMFSNPRTAKEYTDLILKHPQLDGQFKQLFNNLNEIQQLTGRGSGGMLDSLTSVIEDGVSLLNIPNRAQEYLVRRSMFMGEMERLVKREWGVDLLDEVGAGKLDELMSKVDIPEGKMSFAEMAQVATKRALDVTYAKQPDVAAFKTLSSFITRNGLTVAMPFPRFMFNGIELVTQYGAGASLPLTRYVKHLIAKTGKGPFKKPLTLDEIKAGKTAYTDDEVFKLTPKDRERISRNILGVGAIAAAYAYRTDESAPSDYKKLKADDGHVIDTSPQFPLRQMLFLGEVVKQLIDPLKGPDDKRSLTDRVNIENFANWFSGSKGSIQREFAETFIGTNIRTGVGQGIVSEILDLYSGVTGSKTGVIESERSAKAFGRLLGNYMSSWAVPLAQIVDMQRALGFRPSEKKDAAREPVLGDTSQTFMDNLTQPWRSRVGVNPFDTQAENALRRRQEIATADPERKRTGAKILSGLNFSPEDGPEVQYLQNVFNYAPWKIGSKDKSPKKRAWDNEYIRGKLPMLAVKVRREEVVARAEWNARSDAYKAKHTERWFVKQRATPKVEAELKKIRDGARSNRLKMQRGEANDVLKLQKYTKEFRELPPSIRDWTWTQFTKKRGMVDPDYNNWRDVQDLVIEGRKHWETLTKTTVKKGRGKGVMTRR